jgi:pimeloyl-ACP methyl ester carboxylesterase
MFRFVYRSAKLGHFNSPKLDLPSQKGAFTYKEFTLSYKQVGKGPTHFFAFHGFGSSPKDFDPIVDLVTEKHTLWLFDLFHHGKSKYPALRIKKDTLRPDEMAEMIAAFITHNSIEKCNLVGYSLGGKICLSLLEEMPDRIENLLLFAPDGVHIHLVYRFASKNAFGQLLYRMLINWPEPFFALLKAASIMGLVHKRTNEVVLFNMNTKAKRQLLHDVWMSYRNFRPDLKKINEVRKSHGISFSSYFGKYDYVIPAALGKKLSAAIPDAEVQVLECGHLDLMRKAVRRDPNILSTKKEA